MFEVCRTPPLLEQHQTAKVDSGCTGHFILVTAPCLNKAKSRNPLTVRLPNGATMESSHTADLDIPELNAAASKAHVFPGMAHHSLLSVGQLCDEGYIVTFKQDTVTICNSESSKLLSGPRDDTTGLWRINLKQTNKHIPDPIANNVYELRNTGALVHYLHKALFSPTKAAMLQAVKDGHLITWPGLTEDAINKHLKLTPATAMGHLNQRRQNIRSTSTAPAEKQQPPDTDLGTKTHLVYAVVVDQGQLYTGLTGKFPVRSSKGNSYVMLCYIYDYNYIKVVPMKSRSASEWVKAYDSIHQELTVKGFKPKLQTLDNEASTALKNFFTVNNIAYQLVTPHCHRRKSA
jgi:predicted GIY-YIG superfamily endonuclease